MNNYKTLVLVATFFIFNLLNPVLANEVKIMAAEFKQTEQGQWLVKVTLKHDDTGWEHYADNWRVVDTQGNLLGDRVLYHPHVKEQPFTRSLSGVKISEEFKTVYVEAHDKVHGWTSKRLKINLTQLHNGSIRVESD